MAVVEYAKKLFDDKLLVACSAIWTCIANFLFPNAAVKTAVTAVLIIMLLDLLTRIYALTRQNGGFIKALKCREISSEKFAKGTLDKLLIFGVMLVIVGCAYQLTIIESVAVWFSQIVFILIFLRDVLSIIENLSDAGVSGLSPFKKVVQNKMEEYTGCDEKEEIKG